MCHVSFGGLPLFLGEDEEPKSHCLALYSHPSLIPKKLKYSAVHLCSLPHPSRPEGRANSSLSSAFAGSALWACTSHTSCHLSCPLACSCPSQQDLFSRALSLRWTRCCCSFAKTQPQPVSQSVLRWCEIRALLTRLPTAVSTLTVQTTISRFGSLLELLRTYKTVCGVRWVWCCDACTAKTSSLFQIPMNYYPPRPSPS